MTDSSHGHYPVKSTVSFLPIIDMDPTDFSCIYLTIAFIIDQANSLEIQTPVITFDQSLWLIANEIVQTKELNVVLMLGGFHTMMSFMGSIGHLMEGSGLPEALHNVYAKNSVEHMMTGKAVSKAVRGHFLVSSALTTQLLQEFFSAERCRFPHETTEENKQDMHDKENEEFDEDSDYDEDGEDLQTEKEEKRENSPHMLLTDQINDFQKLYETIEKKPDNAANLIDLNENLTELQECITNKKNA